MNISFFRIKSMTFVCFLLLNRSHKYLMHQQVLNLSQKPRFQYFSRVVPPDTHQAEAVSSCRTIYIFFLYFIRDFFSFFFLYIPGG